MRPCTSGSSIVFSKCSGCPAWPNASVAEQNKITSARIMSLPIMVASTLPQLPRRRSFLLLADHFPVARAHKHDESHYQLQGCVRVSEPENLGISCNDLRLAP